MADPVARWVLRQADDIRTRAQRDLGVAPEAVCLAVVLPGEEPFTAEVVQDEADVWRVVRLVDVIDVHPEPPEA